MTAVMSASLTAWIQFTPNPSGYGVPLFSANRNHLFLPKTDNRLQIQTFEDFYNEDNFPVSSNLPKEYKNRVYNINDVVPIPCTIDGNFLVVDPAGGLESLEKQLGKQKYSQLGSQLREIVFNASIYARPDIFIGRRNEINKLVEIWDRVASNAGAFHCVIIYGPQGVGKTTLIAKFRDVLTENRKTDVPTFKYTDGTNFLDFDKKTDWLSTAPDFLTRLKRRSPPSVRILSVKQRFSYKNLSDIIERQRRTGGMLIVEAYDGLDIEKNLSIENVSIIELEPLAGRV